MHRSKIRVITFIIMLLSFSAIWGGSNAYAAVAPLRLGDSGQEVHRLQERLNALNYDVGTIDGKFGFMTQQAVMDFQLDYGLSDDGVVGNITWEALRKASPRVSRSSGSSLAARIIVTARQYFGVPYVFGGTSPAGFDCSGFLQYVFGKNGIQLPRTADVQYNLGLPVELQQLRPGDLVFFSTYAPGPSHDGIYAGGGSFIHASSSRGVTIDRLASSYWANRYIGAKRVLR